MTGRAIPWGARVAAAIVHSTPDWSAVLASRLMGAAARVRLPGQLGRAAVSAYARYFDVNLRDVDPLRLEEGFATFDEFFTRKLRAGARSIDRSADTLVSPCDGELRDVVPIERVTEVIAKGQSYSIGELIADDVLAETFIGGTALTIYLHPRDYHRVHVPCDALAHRVTLVPGRLLPVTEASLVRDPRLFAINERMIHVLETGFGWVAVVMVAAFGVGNMSCAYHRFEAHPRELQRAECQPPARLSKGGDLGIFHLGSTVIVLAQQELTPVVAKLPKAVRLGEPLLRERKGAGSR